jgi:hypothetical protein
VGARNGPIKTDKVVCFTVRKGIQVIWRNYKAKMELWRLLSGVYCLVPSPWSDVANCGNQIGFKLIAFLAINNGRRA